MKYVIIVKIMVFCYKIVTETPRKSGSGSPSPRKCSPVRKLQHVPTSLSQLINSLEYENESVLDSIPEREWRLLSALARKREEDIERNKLADEFRKMWQKEKEEREMVEAETSHQYQQYLSQKRQQERSLQEYKRLQQFAEQQMKRGQLIDCIRHKDSRSRRLLACKEDRKTSELIDKALDEEARAILAADRRCRQGQAEQFRKYLDLANTQKKARDAKKKRNNMLRHSAQRLAINNALNTWETTLLRQEVTALDTAKRAHHALRAALTDQRSATLALERERKQNRARKMAAITAQMREDLKVGWTKGG